VEILLGVVETRHAWVGILPVCRNNHLEEVVDLHKLLFEGVAHRNGRFQRMVQQLLQVCGRHPPDGSEEDDQSIGLLPSVDTHLEDDHHIDGSHLLDTVHPGVRIGVDHEVAAGLVEEVGQQVFAHTVWCQLLEVVDTLGHIERVDSLVGGHFCLQEAVQVWQLVRHFVEDKRRCKAQGADHRAGDGCQQQVVGEHQQQVVGGHHQEVGGGPHQGEGEGDWYL